MTWLPPFINAIKKLHGCTAAYYIKTEPVHLMFSGKTVWKGEVLLFDMIGHPNVEQCYAWEYQDDEGQTVYTAVLRTPPINSAEDAVKAAIVAAGEK